MKGKVKIKLTCKRCGNSWYPRLNIEDVRICPFCKSARWDTLRKEKGDGKNSLRM